MIAPQHLNCDRHIVKHRKQIFIDGAAFNYNRDTDFYYHGNKNKRALEIDDMNPGYFLKYQATEGEGGPVLVNVGWVTG